jgi:alcohol dehydrogenase
MTAANVSTYFCPTRILLGIGSHLRIADVLRQFDARRVFVVVDAAVRTGSFYAGLRERLLQAGCELIEFSEIAPDPGAASVEQARVLNDGFRADLLLAVGGGSSIDVAKAVGILGTNGGRIHDYEGIEKFELAPLPLVAVPTTAGTGSEVSGSCVITDDASGRKMSIRHAALNPARLAILDPLALQTLPAHVAAHAAIDAFVHAFESFLSLQANLITDAMNLQAIELLSGSIRQFVANRATLDAGHQMLVGSCIAGMTFGQTGLGNVHCIARFLGAQFHLSHGLANALCLPHVARFNLSANPDKYARVARAMDRRVDGLPVLEAASQALDAIDALCRDLGIPARLRDAGVDRQSLEQIARSSFEADYSRWNPRRTGVEDFRQILEQAY